MEMLQQMKTNGIHTFDCVFHHEEAKQYVKHHGMEEFYNMLKQMFPSYNLYSVSQDWLNNRRYVCKAKGVNGDILIGWYGAHVM